MYGLEVFEVVEVNIVFGYFFEDSEVVLSLIESGCGGVIVKML